MLFFMLIILEGRTWKQHHPYQRRSFQSFTRVLVTQVHHGFLNNPAREGKADGHPHKRGVTTQALLRCTQEPVPAACATSGPESSKALKCSSDNTREENPENILLRSFSQHGKKKKDFLLGEDDVMLKTKLTKTSKKGQTAATNQSTLLACVSVLLFLRQGYSMLSSLELGL